MRQRETPEGYAAELIRRREYWKLRQREHRQRRIAQKRCVSCPNLAMEGRTICAQCSARIVTVARQRYAESPEIRRDAYFNNVARLYGLTENGFHQLLIAQSGLCGLCWEPFDERQHKLKICVDHKGLIVRGLLHIQCNVSLGIYEVMHLDAERYLSNAPS